MVITQMNNTKIKKILNKNKDKRYKNIFKE